MPKACAACQSFLSAPRELMLSTDAERDCGSCGWETRGWTVLARLGAVWVTAWPRKAGGTRFVCFQLSCPNYSCNEPSTLGAVLSRPAIFRVSLAR